MFVGVVVLGAVVVVGGVVVVDVVVIGVNVVIGVVIVVGVLVEGDKHTSSLVFGFLLAKKHEEHDRTLV